ncbi:hypothetical protein PACILC2_11330 [Paenibacillus cisolokensis]|uniref:Uncharacterized protein n=1 Tax=Paenibacillus cisolokensis TaxID=1658519 RepID=A0ABQ4N314_9BACL|nr:hypothetical protein PACILC2_11330 [Paenibacillus cisolokensis]
MKTTYEQVSVEMTKLFYEGFQDSEIDEFEKYLERIFNNLKNMKPSKGISIMPNSSFHSFSQKNDRIFDRFESE